MGSRYHFIMMIIIRHIFMQIIIVRKYLLILLREELLREPFPVNN